MSAWMCSNRHLSALASAMETKRVPFPATAAPAYFTMLVEQNKTSLRTRYGADAAEELFNATDAFDPTAGFASVAEAIKQCQCYAYQSCENDGWVRSEAKKCIDGLIEALLHDLPGYEDAPWGMA